MVSGVDHGAFNDHSYQREQDSIVANVDLFSRTEEIIYKYSKDYNGTLSDRNVIRLAGISSNPIKCPFFCLSPVFSMSFAIFLDGFVATYYNKQIDRLVSGKVLSATNKGLLLLEKGKMETP